MSSISCTTFNGEKVDLPLYYNFVVAQEVNINKNITKITPVLIEISDFFIMQSSLSHLKPLSAIIKAFDSRFRPSQHKACT